MLRYMLDFCEFSSSNRNNNLGHYTYHFVVGVCIFTIHRPVSDVSGESQILILMTSLARYLDLLTRPVTFYTKSIQLVYLVLSLITIYLVYVAFKSTYSRSHDFNFAYLLIISGFIALAVNYNLKSVHVSLVLFSSVI